MDSEEITQEKFDSEIDIDNEECNCGLNEWEWNEDGYYECIECETCFLLPI